MNFSNNNNSNQQQTSGGMQSAQQAFRTAGVQPAARTEPLYKWLLTALWGIPMILFTIFLGVDYDRSLGDLIDGVSGVVIGNRHWLTVIIFFSWVTISQTITYFLIKKSDKINPDMYIYGFSTLGYLASFYLIPQLGWFDRIWIGFLTMMLGTMVGKLSMMIMVVVKGYQTLKLAKKQMEEFQMKSNPGQPKPEKKTKETIKREKAERMTAMMKREQEVLDQMLREQGIDIDSLDEEYGSTLDGAFEKSDSVDIDNMVVDEEVVEIIEPTEEGQH